MNNPFLDIANDAARNSVDSLGKLAAVNTDVFTKFAQLNLDATGKALSLGLAQAKRLQDAKSPEDMLNASNSFVESTVSESLAQAKRTIDLVAETRAAYLGLLSEAQSASMPKAVKKAA